MTVGASRIDAPQDHLPFLQKRMLDNYMPALTCPQNFVQIFHSNHSVRVFCVPCDEVVPSCPDGHEAFPECGSIIIQQELAHAGCRPGKQPVNEDLEVTVSTKASVLYIEEAEASSTVGHKAVFSYENKEERQQGEKEEERDGDEHEEKGIKMKEEVQQEIVHVALQPGGQGKEPAGQLEEKGKEIQSDVDGEREGEPKAASKHEEDSKVKMEAQGKENHGYENGKEKERKDTRELAIIRNKEDAVMEWPAGKRLREQNKTEGFKVQKEHQEKKREEHSKSTEENYKQEKIIQDGVKKLRAVMGLRRSNKTERIEKRKDHQEKKREEKTKNDEDVKETRTRKESEKYLKQQEITGLRNLKQNKVTDIEEAMEETYQQEPENEKKKEQKVSDENEANEKNNREELKIKQQEGEEYGKEVENEKELREIGKQKNETQRQEKEKENSEDKETHEVRKREVEQEDKELVKFKKDKQSKDTEKGNKKEDEKKMEKNEKEDQNRNQVRYKEINETRDAQRGGKRYRPRTKKNKQEDRETEGKTKQRTDEQENSEQDKEDNEKREEDKETKRDYKVPNIPSQVHTRMVTDTVITSVLALLVAFLSGMVLFLVYVLCKRRQVKCAINCTDRPDSEDSTYGYFQLGKLIRCVVRKFY